MNDKYILLPDNPAARLKSILEQVVSFKGYTKDDLSIAVWSKILNISSEPSVFFTHYGHLFKLVDDAYDSVVKYYPNQSDLHISWKKAYTDALSNRSPFHHKWSEVRAALLQENMYIKLVGSASDLLSHHVRPTKVNELTLESLSLQFQALKDEINCSGSLTEYLKKYLIDELNKILEYLEHYDLYGTEPIERSIYNIASNSEVQKKIDNPLTEKIMAALIVVAGAISLTNDVVQLPDSLESITRYFLPNTSPTPQSPKSTYQRKYLALKSDMQISLEDKT